MGDRWGRLNYTARGEGGAPRAVWQGAPQTPAQS